MSHSSWPLLGPRWQLEEKKAALQEALAASSRASEAHSCAALCWMMVFEPELPRKLGSEWSESAMVQWQLWQVHGNCMATCMFLRQKRVKPFPEERFSEPVGGPGF